MAGGPSTPALAAAVSVAGGLGFLAAGYKTANAVAQDIATLRAATGTAFGVNIFAPPQEQPSMALVTAYAQAPAAEAERQGWRWASLVDDDAYEAKLDCDAWRVPVVSHLRAPGPTPWPRSTPATSPCGSRSRTPPRHVSRRRRRRRARRPGHGGRRASRYFGTTASRRSTGCSRCYAPAHRDRPAADRHRRPDGRPAIAAVLVAGATAAQLGSALMLAPEAGTSAPHRARLAVPGPTRLTRAFSGRSARGIVNRFMTEHDAHAPRAYPQVHHLTSPLRAAARSHDDPDAINLWAGQGHAAAREQPAAEIVRALAADARRALADAAS